MAKIVYYRQCKLERNCGDGRTSHQMSWIPEQYAEKGKVLKLRDSDKKWENGWVVTSVGGRLAEENLPDFHSTSKAHLRATGDAATANGIKPKAAKV